MSVDSSSQGPLTLPLVRPRDQQGTSGAHDVTSKRDAVVGAPRAALARTVLFASAAALLARPASLEAFLLTVDHALRRAPRDRSPGLHDEAALESERRLHDLFQALEHAHVEAAAALIGAERPALARVMNVIVHHARRLVGARWARLELCLDDVQLHPSAAESIDEAASA